MDKNEELFLAIISELVGKDLENFKYFKQRK